MYYKKLFLLFGLLSGLLLFSSCEKDEDGNLQLKTKMSATIDGQEWRTAFRLTNIGTSTTVITATDGPGEDKGRKLIITIYGTDEGTYTLSASVEEASAGVGAVYLPSADEEDDSKRYISTSGEVVISEKDTENETLTGNFHFTVSNGDETISIEDGVFEEIKYQGSSR